MTTCPPGWTYVPLTNICFNNSNPGLKSKPGTTPTPGSVQPTPTGNCPPGFFSIPLQGGGTACANRSNPGLKRTPGSTIAGTQPLQTSGGGNAGSAGTGCSCSITDIGCCISQFGAMVHDTLVSWGEHIAIFVIALIVIILGFYLLNQQAVTNIAKKVIPT